MSRFVKINYDRIIKESPNALLLEIDGEELWIPFSQIEEGQEFALGDSEGSLSVSRWVAEQKDLYFEEW